MTAQALQLSPSGMERKYSFLRWWGLVESPKDGYWQITEKGKLFVDGMLGVPSKVHLYNNKKVGQSEDTVMFNECTEGFSYERLMDPESLNK